MKPSLMWPSARPNSAVNIQAVCPRLGVQDAMARPWSTSIKSHSPPVGRYVQGKVLFDRNMQQDIIACQDNNERYEMLRQFRELTLTQCDPDYFTTELDS